MKHAMDMPSNARETVGPGGSPRLLAPTALITSDRNDRLIALPSWLVSGRLFSTLCVHAPRVDPRWLQRAGGSRHKAAPCSWRFTAARSARFASRGGVAPQGGVAHSVPARAARQLEQPQTARLRRETRALATGRLRYRSKSGWWTTSSQSCWCAVRACRVALPSDEQPVQLGGDDAAQSLSQLLEPTCSSVVVARCLDAALLNAANADGTRQLAVVGHGADTRAFRLSWPVGVRLFELGPHDALAHAELAFHGQGIRPNKSMLLRRVPADVSGKAALGNGWASRLLAAGFMPDEATAWALQGVHLLQPCAVEALLVELGSVAAIGSVATGEAALPEMQLRTLLAQCGFQLEACEPLPDVAAALGRELPSTGSDGERVLFSARKTRLTGVQHERLQAELQRAEDESGEEGFGDAP